MTRLAGAWGNRARRPGEASSCAACLLNAGRHSLALRAAAHLRPGLGICDHDVARWQQQGGRLGLGPVEQCRCCRPRRHIAGFHVPAAPIPVRLDTDTARRQVLGAPANNDVVPAGNGCGRVAQPRQSGSRGHCERNAFHRHRRHGCHRRTRRPDKHC